MLTASRRLVSVEEGSARLLGCKTLIDQGSETPRHSGINDGLLMKVSESKTEREQALQLVQRVYSQAGLVQDNQSRLRVLPQHLVDTTEILVGKRHSRVVFTVSLVGDGDYGLPLESLFSEEVAQMRAQGLRLAEASCLANACDFGGAKERLNTFWQGISLLFQVARDRNIDRLLLAVHPRHAKTYDRVLGCVPCTDSREYAAVRGNPAVLCRHDFAQLDRTRYPYYDRMYGHTYDRSQLSGTPMSEAEKQYFEQFLPVRDYEFMPMAG